MSGFVLHRLFSALLPAPAIKGVGCSTDSIGTESKCSRHLRSSSLTFHRNDILFHSTSFTSCFISFYAFLHSGTFFRLGIPSPNKVRPPKGNFFGGIAPKIIKTTSLFESFPRARHTVGLTRTMVPSGILMRLPSRMIVPSPLSAIKTSSCTL